MSATVEHRPLELIVKKSASHANFVNVIEPRNRSIAVTLTVKQAQRYIRQSGRPGVDFRFGPSPRAFV